MIELDHVYRSIKTQAASKNILEDISVQIPFGSKVSIIGKSGSGKTTLMNILGFLDRPSQGSYFFAGEDTQNFDDQKLSGMRASTMGYVFQSFNLLNNITVLENILLPCQYHPDRQNRKPLEFAYQLLEWVGLQDRMKSTPQVLSGGEKQRVAIARALINQPKVLLADEPTGALDSQTRNKILELFHKVHAEFGLTTIMVTHDMEIAEFGDMKITIKDGQIV